MKITIFYFHLCLDMFWLILFRNCIRRRFTLQIYTSRKHYVIMYYEYITSLENVLENVISAYVSDDASMDKQNLMFAVPDQLKYPEQMLGASALQDDVQSAIQYRIGTLTVPVPDQSFESVTLTELGNAKRFYTGKAAENIIRSGWKNRSHGVETDIHVCRLAALYINTTLLSMYSLGYIKTAEVDDTGLCTLTSTFEDSITYYKQVEDQIFQVWPDNPNMEPLLSKNDRTQSCSIQ